MATWSIGTCIQSAREILKDEDSECYRYEQSELISYFNIASTQLLRLRPDVFRVTEQMLYVDPNETDYTSDDYVFPYPIQLYGAFIYFIAGYAELRDDEFSDDARASKLLAKFETELGGTHVPK